MKKLESKKLESKTYKEYVLDIVKKLMPAKKKTKFTNEYYYDMFLFVLKDVTSWRALKITKNYEGKKKNHYTTIRKKFNDWCKKDIFKLAYMEMTKNKNIINRNDKKALLLFIDSTFIDNKTGSELIGVNPSNYKKRATKLSIICDKDKNILTIKEFRPTINDCITVEETINEIEYKKRMIIVGDKGYLVNKNVKDRLRKRLIRMVVPRRKSQKKKRLVKKDKEYLKERNKIENAIKTIKSYERIVIRKDRKIKTYIGFVWLGCGIRLEKNKIN